jgi:hypothetical protein
MTGDFGSDPLRQPLLAETTRADEATQTMIGNVDEESSPKGSYSKVRLDENEGEETSDALIREDEDGSIMEDEITSVAEGGDSSLDPSSASASAVVVTQVLHKTLFPDQTCVVGGIQIMEGQFTVKLLKFLIFTFASISFLHWLVSHRTNHRDTKLSLGHVWRYEGNLIASDAVIFFVVGRLWRQKGVDHLAWLGVVILSNIYFESQHYASFMRHSFTLYEMHCGKILFTGSRAQGSRRRMF